MSCRVSMFFRIALKRRGHRGSRPTMPRVVKHGNPNHAPTHWLWAGGERTQRCKRQANPLTATCDPKRLRVNHACVYTCMYTWSRWWSGQVARYSNHLPEFGLRIVTNQDCVKQRENFRPTRNGLYPLHADWAMSAVPSR